MGQWCHRLEDHCEVCSSMQHQSWCEVVHTWKKRAGEQPMMELAAGGVGSFEHSALRGGYSAVEVGILRRGL